MGVKYTKDLTRENAESRYVEYRIRWMDLERRFREEAALMSDGELESVLERLNDAAHDGEGFENYSIGSS